MSCTWFWSTCQTSTLWDSASSVLLQHSVAHHFPNDMTFPNHMTQGSGEVRSCFLAVWQVAHLTCTVGELCLFLYNKPAWLVCILVFSKLKGSIPKKKNLICCSLPVLWCGSCFCFSGYEHFQCENEPEKTTAVFSIFFFGITWVFFQKPFSKSPFTCVLACGHGYGLEYV